MATDVSEPKMDRGFGFLGAIADEETKSITDSEGGALSERSDSSLGSPRLALSVAQPSAYCSRIIARTSSRIPSASRVDIMVSPIVGLLAPLNNSVVSAIFVGPGTFAPNMVFAT